MRGGGELQKGRGHREREGTVGNGIAMPTCTQITNLSLPPTEVEGSERQKDQDGNCADPPQKRVTQECHLGIRALIKPIWQGLPHHWPGLGWGTKLVVT